MKQSLIYSGKVWLKTLLFSSLLAGITLRLTHPADDDLPVPILCILLFGLQLICCAIPALLFSWWVNNVSQKPAGPVQQKLTIWIGAIIIVAIFLAIFIVAGPKPQAAATTVINGVDDLAVFCTCGLVTGLSLFIWLQRLRAGAKQQTI